MSKTNHTVHCTVHITWLLLVTTWLSSEQPPLVDLYLLRPGLGELVLNHPPPQPEPFLSINTQTNTKVVGILIIDDLFNRLFL